MNTNNLNCCPKCFLDQWLIEEFFPNASTKNGSCSFCKSDHVPLIHPSELRNFFELLTSIYVTSDNGKTLNDLLQEDWKIFSSINSSESRLLLAEILDDGEIVRKSHLPSDICKTDRLHTWEQLKLELMYENRYFLGTRLDTGRLEELLSQLLIRSSKLQLVWYRSRIQKNNIPFNISDMGSPPKRISSAGRANPAGIPYLYLASDIQTCISEVRPHVGESITVAEFHINPNLKLVDLRDPRSTITPFIFGDENEVALLRGDIEFLSCLGDELTKPVLPYTAAIDYIPSQFLCEFIKKSSYDGVLYNSLTGGGVNLALFDASKATGGEITSHLVKNIKVSY